MSHEVATLIEFNKIISAQPKKKARVVIYKDHTRTQIWDLFEFKIEDHLIAKGKKVGRMISSRLSNIGIQPTVIEFIENNT